MADNNWKSKFVTDYGIKGIPRFIIIDIDGRIVSSDAPRPSNSEIRVIFDELLLDNIERLKKKIVLYN